METKQLHNEQPQPVACNPLSCPNCGFDYSEPGAYIDPYKCKNGTKFPCLKCLYSLAVGVNNLTGERWIGLEPVPDGGYMVSYEDRSEGGLAGKFFPNKHKGEKLIETEEKAWKLAKKFEKENRGKVVNVYVTYSDFRPVNGYEKREIACYPQKMK